MWYLFRHPQTILNEQQKYHGWSYAPYSHLGEKQLKNMVEFSKQLPVNQILCSDLPRCQEAAEQIALVKKLQPVSTKLLRELNFGEWHGYSYNELAKKYPNIMKKWVDDPWTNAPLNGETLTELKNRCTELYKKYKETNLLIVSHGGVIALFQQLINNKPYWQLLPKNNQCITIDWLTKQIESIDI